MDQPLVEVQTDKVSAELSAPKAGIVKEILIEQGETVMVGTSILMIEEIRDKEELEQRQEKSTVKNYRSEAVRSQRRVLASPYTRKIARENQVNIEDVLGTGEKGRVIDQDVYAVLEGFKKKNLNNNRRSLHQNYDQVPISQGQNHHRYARFLMKEDESKLPLR